MEHFLYKAILKELSKLPHQIQGQAEKIVFQELTSTNPFNLEYLEHMTGYHDKYKIRIGKYRIGITIDKSQKIVDLPTHCSPLRHLQNLSLKSHQFHNYRK